MKKFPYVTIVLLVLSIAFTACKEKDKTIHVEGITLNKTSVLLYVGDGALALSATVLPRDATDKSLNWNSSDTTIAVVDSNIVFAKFPGETTITVTTQDGNHSATCEIAVTMPGFGYYNDVCNGDLPGWGAKTGAVSFVSDSVWTIGSQTWSDAVTTTSCREKTTYDGTKTAYNHNAKYNGHNADCRSNPEQKGDLFSWCAVIRFATFLCPSPWRVPTADDFRELDIALGGTGVNGGVELRDKYISTWSAVFGGISNESGDLDRQGSLAAYWTSRDPSSSADGWLGRSWNIHAGDGGGWPVVNGSSASISTGRSLRCVRDN